MFSDTELKVIKIIGKRRITITDITAKFYGNFLPFNANNMVAATVRRISRKCEYNELEWTLDGVGAGRAGRVVWKLNKGERGC